MAYDSTKLARAPQSWADFWNVREFPGKRGLRKGAKYTLEVALLADGVKAEDLYKVLATPEGSAAPSPSSTSSNRTSSGGGRRPAAAMAGGRRRGDERGLQRAHRRCAEGGVKLAIVWPGSLYDPEYWAVVKGTPNKALAEKFIAFASQPQTQKVFSEQIPYGPVHKGTLALLPKTVQEVLPTAPANLEGARAVDAEFWVDHGEELEQRFMPGRRAERAARRQKRRAPSRPGPSGQSADGVISAALPTTPQIPTALGIQRLHRKARRPHLQAGEAQAGLDGGRQAPAEDEVEQRQLPVEQRAAFSRSPSSTAW